MTVQLGRGQQRSSSRCPGALLGQPLTCPSGQAHRTPWGPGDVQRTLPGLVWLWPLPAGMVAGAGEVSGSTVPAEGTAMQGHRVPSGCHGLQWGARLARSQEAHRVQGVLSKCNGQSLL